MYTENEKSQIRTKIIHQAIEMLTIKRQESTISNPTYIKKVKEYVQKDQRTSQYSLYPTNTMLHTWSVHYNSLLGRKVPPELKVAFLAGPNPENDIAVFIENGILEENIWAFESVKEIYQTAIDNLRKHYPRIKIIKVKIDQFFMYSSIKFDIIYLDFCGPLFSRDKKNKTVLTLHTLFMNHTLNSPGILLTNFSLPSKQQDKVGRDILEKLTSLYLYPKEYLDNGKVILSENGWYLEQWHHEMLKKYECWYGEFIKRFIMDMASVITPFQKLAKSKEYFELFFNLSSNEKKQCLRNLLYMKEETEINEIDESYELLDYGVKEDIGGHIASEPYFYSLPWFIYAIKEKTDYFNEGTDFMKNFFSDEFNNNAKSFLKQMIGLEEDKIMDQICIIYYMLFEMPCKQYSDTLKEVFKMSEFVDHRPRFCDEFTFQSVIGELFGQLLVPYHVNVSQSKGWIYEAKSTQMHTNLFVLDECRYIYDMMPTIDMIMNAISDLDYQLCYRYALDALNKNQFYFNQELFYGNAVIDKNHKVFAAKTFPETEKIGRVFME